MADELKWLVHLASQILCKLQKTHLADWLVHKVKWNGGLPEKCPILLHCVILSPGRYCRRILWIQQCYAAAAAASHSCVRSNSCISWWISFKFCMEVYRGKIYTPIVFGDAAPSVSSFIGSKVIFWWKSCVRSAGHISWWISLKFSTDVYHSQIYTPIVFGDAAPSVPSFIGSKVIFWFTFLCALQQLHFSTDFFQILYGGVKW